MKGKQCSPLQGSDKRKWRSKDPDPNFIPGGKKQQLNQIAGSPGYDESQASFDDNLERMHHFDEDVSDCEKCGNYFERSHLKEYEKYREKLIVKLCENCAPSKEFCDSKNEIFKRVNELFRKYNMYHAQQHTWPLYGIRDALDDEELTNELENAKETFIEQIKIWGPKNLEEIIKKANEVIRK